MLFVLEGKNNCIGDKTINSRWWRPKNSLEEMKGIMKIDPVETLVSHT